MARVKSVSRLTGIGSSPPPRPLLSREIAANTIGITLNGLNQKILPRNINRAYLLIQNRSAATVFCSFGTSIDDQNFNCFEIAPGGNYEPITNQLKTISSDIYLKSSVANSNVSITEGILV